MTLRFKTCRFSGVVLMVVRRLILRSLGAAVRVFRQRLLIVGKMLIKRLVGMSFVRVRLGADRIAMAVGAGAAVTVAAAAAAGAVVGFRLGIAGVALFLEFDSSPGGFPRKPESRGGCRRNR
jgi:hypothetical protein